MALSVVHKLRCFARAKRWRIVIVLCFFLSFAFLSSSFAIVDLTLFGPKRYERLKGKPTVYTDTFDGCASSDIGILRVRNGDGKKTRVKSARIYLNGVKVASEKEFKQKVPSFEKPVTLKKAVNELKVVLKSGHHGYIKKLAEYQAKRDGLDRQLERLQELKRTIEGSITIADLEQVLRAVREAKKGIEENESRLDRVGHDLDDDADNADDDSDDEPETDLDWTGQERLNLEKRRNEVKESLRRCEDARRDLDRTPKNKRDKDHGKKDEALKDIASLLRDLDRVIEKTVDKLAEIEEKIETIKKKGPSFLVIEVLGRDCDSTSPVISNPEPADGSILNVAAPRIAASYADNSGGSGIDTASVRLVLDGSDDTASASVTKTGVSFVPSSPLPDMTHAVTVTVADLSRNPASFTWHFTTDTVAPVVVIDAPAADAYLNTPSIAVTGSVSEPVSSVTVNGQAAAVSGTSFSFTGLALAEGTNTITVEARDAAGNPGTQSIIVTLDTKPPVITITTPSPDAYINTPGITVAGTVNEPVTSVTVNGTAARLSGSGFSAEGVQLTEGRNTIDIQATDRAGNTGAQPVTVTLDTALPVIRITAPAQDAYLNTPSTTVSGTVNEPVTTLTVNGMAATVSGASFSAAGIALAEGTNTIAVSATDRAGNPGTNTVTVTLDTAPPVVTITTPANGLLRNTPQITVSGTVNEPIIEARVNGANALIAETKTEWSISVSLVEGANTITVTVKDRAGNPGSASISVTLDSTAPQAPVLIVPAAATNVGTASVSGTAEPGSAVNLYLTNSQGIQVPAGSGSADSQGAFTFPDIALADGNNTFTATATDSAGNTSGPSAEVSVLFDTRPPVITITAPENNSFTNQAQVLVTGSVDEPVTLKINGTAVTMDGLAFERALTLTEGINSIQVMATDLAGNSSTATVLVTLDTAPPVVSISSPVNGLLTNNSSVLVTGTVNETVSSVSVNGTQAQVSGSMFSLASFTLAEGRNSITAEAVDRAGNKGTSPNVSVTLDSTPPAVTLSAPAQAVAGATLGISTAATDAAGITLIEVSANGLPLWSSTLNSELSAQNSFSYTLSPDLVSGSIVDLLARVYDAAGNTGTATGQVQITGGPSGPGFIQGEVYDDTKGLRLDGANVDFVSTDGHGLTRITTQTDGGYFAEAPAGDYLVTLTKPGFTTVERVVTVMPEKKSVAIDGRLTPVSAEQHLIGAAGGTATAILAANGRESTRIELSIPANTLTEQKDIRLTTISNQGLAGLLPQGWSPIGVIDIRSFATEGTEITEGTSFGTQGAALKIPVTSGLSLAPSSLVALVRYDKISHLWIVQNAGTVSADGQGIVALISTSGEYAFVIPDQDPGPLALDAALPSVSSATSVAEGISASGRVVPPVAPPSVGLKAVGEVVLSSASSAVSSGVILNGRVTERFDLYSGDAVVPSEYVQDIVLYRYPCITGLTLNSELGTPNSGKAGSTFPVTPSREYTIAELMLGKVGIEISLPQQQETGVMVGADGGRLLDGDGNVLAIPAGALTGTTPVETKTVPISLLSSVVGNDFTLIRAVSLNLAGRTLSSSAELSVPAPVGVDSSLPLVVAKAIEVRGVQKLKLVALARLSGSLITSYPFSVPSVSSVAKGIVSSGTFFFLQAKSPLGFVTGTVTSTSGSPFAYALTTSSTCSLADLTGIDGRYLIASTVSGFTATAVDVLKNDAGSAAGTVTAPNETVSLDLVIQATPPRVLSAAPSEVDKDGKAYPTTAVTITFSEPVKRETVTSLNGNAITLLDASGKDIKGTFSVSPDGAVYSFFPETLLLTEATYTIRVAAAVQDLQGYPLGQAYQATFAVRDMTPPPPPPAGSITGTFPDADGYVTITGTQGSAEPGCTVLIINDNSGEIVGVIPASNGSFTGRIMAMLGDEIKIAMLDAAGNQTVVTYITFKSDDGKYLVTTKGGVVEGEGGSQLVIPDGALSGPAVIKLTQVAENQLPHPLEGPGNYLAAVNIDTGGVTFKKEVKLSVPAPSGHDPATPVFLTQPRVHLNPDGTEEKVYVVIDSTKVIDGRITTASAPFSGVFTIGIFSFCAFPTIYPAIVSGYTYRDMNENTKYDEGIDKPIKNAIIRSPDANTYISYSNSAGFYATFTSVVNNPGSINPEGCRDYTVTAIHPWTMYRVKLTSFVCIPPYNIQRLNFKLAGPYDEGGDRMAPAIGMNMSVLPGQAGDPRFVSGTIPVNTQIDVPVEITDQSSTTQTLTVEYKTPESGTQSCTVPLFAGGQTVPVTVSVPDPNNPAVPQSVTMQKTYYSKDFGHATVTGNSFPCSLNLSDYLGNMFIPSQPGAYTLTAKATDENGFTSTRTMSVRAVLAGEIPASLPGPPRVDELVPGDGAREIMVTMPVTATFSERVDNVTSFTFSLFDETLGATVDADVYTSFEGGRMRSTLQPRTNLMFSHTYRVTLQGGQNGIVDSDGEPLATLVTTFTTKVPQVYDLITPFDDQARFTPTGRGDIALYTHEASGRTFAYVAAGQNGLWVVEVTDPTRPEVLFSSLWMENFSSVTKDYRGVYVDQENGILAVTDLISFSTISSTVTSAAYGTGQGTESNFNAIGSVRFYNIREVPIGVGPGGMWMGMERLAEQYSGVPGRVAIRDGYAYVATVMVGVQVVDINKSKDYRGTNVGESIVGVYATYELGYRQPMDVVAYRGGKLLVTTTSGALLLLDVSMPEVPQLLSAYPANPPLPAGSYAAYRTAAVADFAYTDGSGNTKLADVAVTTGPDAKIYTVDLTDPYNLKHYGPVKDSFGHDVLCAASAVTISRTSGIAYLVDGNGVYVVDIKNPFDPKLLNIIHETPAAPGSGTISPLGYNKALVEKDGWVYLVNQEQGLRVLDFAKKFYIVEPKTDAKIAIKNDANGDPIMPPLSAKVAFRDGTPIPSTQQVCWKTKVEYFVNTAAAPQRSRKGLDPSGAGQGKDGFLIPYSTDVNNQPPDCRYGPTYTIPWGTNFGGGRITIKAETFINGELVEDTYVGKIEGQTFTEDNKFKENICKYLETPSGVNNYQTEILTPLGYNKVFRMMAYQESRYRHFYPSIYGIPKSAIYPRENSKNSQCDGGFGVMQLTLLNGSNPYPTYLQIWNWKENINAGVKLVKDKLRRAKNYLNAHPPGDSVYGKSIIRMETYHRYGPSYTDADGGYISYWKWNKKKGWVFSTDNWLHADDLRAIEDAVDAGDFSLTDPDMRSWKYDGEP